MPRGELLAHAGKHYEPLAFGAYDILLVILFVVLVFRIVRAAARVRSRREVDRVVPRPLPDGP